MRKDPHHITADLVQEQVTDAIRRRCGRGKRYSVEEIASRTGIDARTMAAYHTGQNRPSVHRLLRLAMVLGPSFLSEVLLSTGLGGVKSLHPAKIDAPTTARELVAEASLILERLADGNLDHRERVVTGRELLKLVAKLEQQAQAMLDKPPTLRVARGGKE